MKNYGNSFLLTSTALFAVLTAIGSWIQIPMLPVPLTLQTAFVILAGLFLPVKYATLSQLLYLLMGLLGLPVFGFGGGMQYVVHPTFGYLLAFPFAAFSVAQLKKHAFPIPHNTFISNIFFGLVGTAIIYLIGITGLYLNLSYLAGQSITLQKILLTGMLIFLPGDLLKILLVSWIADKLKYIHFIN
ncbi:biotin transporter BioY [bacterium]|nr:biotin transporter BioY [bacterium]